MWVEKGSRVKTPWAKLEWSWEKKKRGWSTVKTEGWKRGDESRTLTTNRNQQIKQRTCTPELFDSSKIIPAARSRASWIVSFCAIRAGQWCVRFMRASVEEFGLLTTSMTRAATQLDACNCSPAQTQFVRELLEGKPENSIVGLERACSHDVVVNR